MNTTHTPVGLLSSMLKVAGLAAVVLVAALLVLADAPRESALAATGLAEHESASAAHALHAEVRALRDQVDRLQQAMDRSVRTAIEAGDDVAVDASEAAAAPVSAPAADVEPVIAVFPTLTVGDRKSALRRLRELARWGDQRARTLMFRSLQDHDAGVRAHAVRELAELKDPDLQQHLAALAGDADRRVREETATAAARVAGDAAGPLLARLLGDKDRGVLIAALDSVDELACKAVVPQVRPLLAASNLDVAARAAASLRRLGEESGAAVVVQRVLEHFGNGDVPARVRDVNRLQVLRAITELRRILDSDSNSTVRFEAQRALAELER